MKHNLKHNTKLLRYNIVWILIVILVSIIVYLIVDKQNNVTTLSQPTIPFFNIKSQQPSNEMILRVSEDPTDSLKNIYAPPLRYNDADYRQIGYLKNNHERIPLFGKQIDRHDRWSYYTMDGSIKLPIEHNKRKCTQTPGCFSLSDNDEVHVDGSKYNVTLYDMKTIAY